MEAPLQQSASLLEDISCVTDSYVGMAMLSYFISGVLVTLIPLSAFAKFYKPSSTKSTQTDAIVNVNEQGRQPDLDPQRDTYFGNGEINVEAEKQKSYVKAVMEVYDDVTDRELKCAMKYLQSKRVTMIDAANFAKAIVYLRTRGQNVEGAAGAGHDNGREAAREELIKILIESGFEDAEDVVGRYEKTYPGSVPTRDEFIEFYETLRGIVDLEKKLAREKVVAEKEKRMKDQQIQEEKRKAEMKDQQIQEEKRKAEMKDQQIQEEKRKAEQEKRKAEQEKRKAVDLEIKAQRSMCKLCLDEEVAMLCLPCKHLYCCSDCSDVVRQHGECHICHSGVHDLISIRLS